jgi:putative ABC transport system substrate-binding protein
MSASSIPVQSGLVTSLAHPGGNITGLSIDLGPEIAGKMLQLLKETVPTVSRVTMIHTADVGGSALWLDPSQTTTSQEIELMARTLGMTLHPLVVRRFDDFPGALNTLPQTRPDALVADNSALAYVQRRLLVEFAAKHRLPAVYAFRESAQSGGLLSYGADLKDVFRRAGGYVDKILKGARPADLPIQQPTKFELVINLKTAKTLGLTIPPSVLARADEVIQ